MSNYSWIEHMFRTEGFEITPKLHWFLSAGVDATTPYDLLPEKYAILNLEALQQQCPTLKCVPFAHRRDRDDLFAVVLQDPVYKRGQVILVDVEDVNYYHLETAYSSLEIWAENVWTTLDGYNSHRK